MHYCYDYCSDVHPPFCCYYCCVGRDDVGEHNEGELRRILQELKAIVQSNIEDEEEDGGNVYVFYYSSLIFFFFLVLVSLCCGFL